MKPRLNAYDDPETAQSTTSTALRALSDIAAIHGVHVDKEQIRRRFPFDGDEPSPQLLMKMAEGFGLSVKKLRIKSGDLAKLVEATPALLVLKDGKVALLERVMNTDTAPVALLKNLESTDGAELLLDEPRLFQAWDGQALLVKKRWGLTDQDRPFDFTWLVGAVVREGKLFRDIGVAAFLISMLSLAPIMISMNLIDRVLFNRSMPTLQVLSALLIGLIVFEMAFAWLRKRLTVLATNRIDAHINLHIFDKVLNLPLSFFEKTSTGAISSKIAQVWHVRSFLVEVVAGTMLDGVTLLVLLPVLFYLNWVLASLVVCIAFLVLLIYYFFLPGLRKRHHVMVDAETMMGSHQVESIFGIKTIKSLSLDGFKRKERDKLVADVAQARRNYEFFQVIPQTLVLPLERLIFTGTFALGAYMVLTNSISTSIGAVVAFAMLSGRVTAPIIQLANLINAYEHARGAMGVVGDVLNTPPESGRSGNGLREPIHGKIIFDNVKFRYSPTASYAIDGASFEIPQGTIFGVMGRSGSGKTTVTRLLQGLNSDYEGTIKIDGMDLREIDLDHLRTNIGVVPQENFLFKSSVRENIAAARPTIGFDKIVRAAQMAGAEEFIERLPNGYSTPVEEGAVNFSGGQRQRMAIARALVVDPPILVLDEATSALDAESEAIVNANLMRIAKGRTVIIISHRLSSLMMADNILVMERGKVYDIGKHAELLDRCDIYKTLWHQQNRHLDAEGVNNNG